MTYIPPNRFGRMLCAYFLAGLTIGCADHALRAAATRRGSKPGYMTALDVNIVLPAIAAVLAVLYPRVRTAVIGAVLLAGGFALGPRLLVMPNVFRWAPGPIVASISPLLVAACVGYALVGIVACHFVRPWRRVGLPDAALRCTHCGYLLVQLPQSRCPECGEAFDPQRVSAAANDAPTGGGYRSGC